MDRPLFLIVNPAAGHGRARQIVPAVRAALDQAGAGHDVIESASLGHARELAAAAVARGDVVVGVGGDGLVGALAGATAAARPAAQAAPGYGLIPAGRGNDLARELGIPADPAAAARVLAAGSFRPIDLIEVSRPGHADVIVAGSVYAGLPSVAGEIANTSRWLPGPLVYNVAALRALARWKPVRFTVRIDGETGASRQHDFDGYAVIIANNPFFGAGMRVAPSALIDDGMLDLVLMRHGPKPAFVRALLKVKDGSHVDLPEVDLDLGADITISMDRDIPAAADGEPIACASPLPAGTPLRIRVLPAALRVLTPAVTG